MAPIGAWLTLKELQFCEETTYGVLPASPVFTPVGYEPRVMFREDPKMLPVPQPGSEDVETIQQGGVREITWDIIYRPTDTKFAKYGVNAQGGGSGSIDKSFTLLMSVNLNTTTETWLILPGCRPDTTIISGRAGGNLEFRGIGNAQTFPLPTSTNPGYIFATSSTLPPIQLKDGGLTPLTIAGVSYDVNSITVSVHRNLSIMPQPNSRDAQIILPQNRDITGTLAIAWESTGLLSVLGTQTAPTMIWTLNTTLNSAITVTATQFTRLNSLQFLTGDPAIFEAYSYQGSSVSMT
jgi:hypothetical protein